MKNYSKNIMKFWKELQVSSKKNDTELVYNENNLKAKIKCYIGKINTHLHNNKTPKDGSQFIF